MDCSTPGLPVHHQLPELTQTRLLSQWCHPAISSSVVPFSFCPQSFPASGYFPKSHFFASGDQSIGASASASRQAYFEKLFELYDFLTFNFIFVFSVVTYVFIAKHIEICQYWDKAQCTEELVSLKTSLFISRSLNIQPEEMHTYY